MPVVPLIGAGLCIFLMTYLDGTTWIRFGIWMVIGLVVYAAYGYRHSKLALARGARLRPERLRYGCGPSPAPA